MMLRTLASFAVVLLSVTFVAAKQPAPAQTKDAPAPPKISSRDAKTIAAVRAVIEAQAVAWNRGDIEGYMDGYARSADTTFISGDNLTRGWQTVLDRYKKSYDSREKMGQLTFSELEIKPTGKDAALVTGRWQLTRAKDTPHGRFTLIFRQTAGGWRIIHDHTSSAN